MKRLLAGFVHAMTFRRPSLALLSCALLGGAGGCLRGEAHDAGEPLRQTVRVALTFTRIGEGEGIRFEGQGHFARYPASEAEQVPALLGIPDNDAIPLDGCRRIDSARELDRALAAANGPIDVKLLEAGRLVARAPGEATQLEPKHYPELTPFVAGVVYGTEDSVPLPLVPGGTYEVAGEGGEAVGPFTQQVQAPRAFPSLDVPTYRRGGDLELRWREAGEVSEPAVLSVSWSARGTALEVRCRIRDDGSFTVGRELLQTMPPPSQLASAEVVLVRARRAPIVAPGAAPGEVVVALREVVPLAVSNGPAAGATAPPARPSEGAATEGAERLGAGAGEKSDGPEGAR